jgi:hypothetical protein
MDLEEIGWPGGGGDVDWIDLAQYRDEWWGAVNAAMTFRVP